MQSEQDYDGSWHSDLEEMECDWGEYVGIKDVHIALREAWADGAKHVIEGCRGNDNRTTEEAITDFLKLKGVID